LSSLYLNEDLHPDAFAVGARIPVWGAEARHAAQVARVRAGERIAIGDGRGRIGWGRVVHVAQQEVAIEVDEVVVDAPRRPRLRLVQALAKGDRDELAIQAATELGVDEVVPWQAARSVSRWDGAKLAKGLERWRAVVREATKQAIRPTIPEVLDPVDTAALARAIPVPERGEAASRRPVPAPAPVPAPDPVPALTLVLEPTGRNALTRMASDGAFRPVGLIALVVGPEGGIAPEELAVLEEAGALPVRLGPEVLRTSTAGPAAIAALNAILGRW